MAGSLPRSPGWLRALAWVIPVALAPAHAVGPRPDIVLTPPVLVPPPDGTEFGCSLGSDGSYLLVGAAAVGAPPVNVNVYAVDEQGIHWLGPLAEALSGRNLQIWCPWFAMDGSDLVVGGWEAERGLVIYVLAGAGASRTVKQVITIPGQFANRAFSARGAVQGDWMIVGLPTYSNRVNAPAGDRVGLVLIYRREAGSWVFESTLSEPIQPAIEGAFDGPYFGSSVRVLDNELLIGAENNGSEEAIEGSVWSFRPIKGSWVPQQRLRAVGDVPFEGSGRFGAAMELSGLQLLVTAPYLGPSGRTYAFVNAQGTWVANGASDGTVLPGTDHECQAPDAGPGERAVVLRRWALRTDNVHLALAKAGSSPMHIVGRLDPPAGTSAYNGFGYRGLVVGPWLVTSDDSYAAGGRQEGRVYGYRLGAFTTLLADDFENPPDLISN